MNKTIEEIFLDTKAIFQKQAEEAAKAAMDEIYDHYLPFVGMDTDSNVYFKACDIVRRFFSGQLRDGEVPHNLFGEHTGELARAKLLEEHPEKLQNAIIADLKREVASLKEAARHYRY